MFVFLLVQCIKPLNDQGVLLCCQTSCITQLEQKPRFKLWGKSKSWRTHYTEPGQQQHNSAYFQSGCKSWQRQWFQNDRSKCIRPTKSPSFISRFREKHSNFCHFHSHCRIRLFELGTVDKLPWVSRRVFLNFIHKAAVMMHSWTWYRCSCSININDIWNYSINHNFLQMCKFKISFS